MSLLQPGDLGIDYSYARPDLAVAVQSGAKFVIRYTAGIASLPSDLSYPLNKGKLITPVEFNTIISHGLDLIANDEWYPGRMVEGAKAGRQDAYAAGTVWHHCGLAKGAVIYVSLDEDPPRSQWPAARDYLISYEQELAHFGYVLGVYAGTPFLKYVRSNAFGRFLIRFLWRPNAGSWSNDGLPYQPDTSTPAKRLALVSQALGKTPALIWQTGNYWFNKQADENLILRVPVGSHLEAEAAKPPAPTPTPKPTPAPDGKEFILDAQAAAEFEKVHAEIADLKAAIRGAFTDSKGNAHTLRTWLTKLAGKTVDLP